MSHEITPLEAIRRTNPTGNEFWSSCDFALVLGYVNFRHFEAVIAKAKTACINSGQLRLLPRHPERRSIERNRRPWTNLFRHLDPAAGTK
jgi:hypothetical protein